MNTAILICVTLGVASAVIFPHRPPTTLPYIPPQPVTPPRPSIHVLPQYQIPQTYILPSGAELIVGPIKSTFSCIDKIYGYYADLDNNCQIFHVCVPFVDEENNQTPVIYNFFCGNQTVFDQANLICSHPDQATPCSQAQDLYRVNENFGKTDRPLRRE